MTAANVMKKVKRTKSFLFVLPMLSDTIEDFMDEETKVRRAALKKADNPLINCYIGDVDKPQYKEHIFVLYKFVGTKKFGVFENELMDHPCFVDMYNPTPKYDMFVFSVPDDFKLEYDLFISEKPRIYRRFSEVYKKHVLKFLDPIVDSKSVHSILYHEEERYLEQEALIGAHIPRDLDNYSIPIIEDETFNKLNFM